MKNSKSVPKAFLFCLGILFTLFMVLATDGFASQTDYALAKHKSITSPLTHVMDAMMKMMERMKAIPMSGNADIDFAMMMKEHHQGAIEMAKAEIEMGNNEALKNKAKQLIDKQKSDMAKIDSFIQKGKKKSDKNAADTPYAGNKQSENSMFSQMISTVMEKMNQLMHQEKTSEDVDHEFVTLMSVHHQGAIDMSQAEIDHGANPSLKQLAKTTIDDSQKDIKELQTLLKRHHTK